MAGIEGGWQGSGKRRAEKPGAVILSMAHRKARDAQGAVTTVLFKGCALRCVWCPTPEARWPGPEVILHESDCVGCGDCVKACTAKALTMVGEGQRRRCSWERRRCVGCGACVEACGVRALELCGRILTVDQAMAEIRKDVDPAALRQGGLIASGGEPLIYPAFLVRLFAWCRESGVPTTLETKGCASAEALSAVLPFVDSVIFDLSLIDSRQHARFTGQPNEAILGNASVLGCSQRSITFYVPMVASITDTEENLEAMATFLAGLAPGVRVRLGRRHQRVASVLSPPPDPPRESDEDKLSRAVEVITRHGLGCEVEE